MRPLLLLGLAGAVFAQGTTPKAKPEDYPAHAQARSAALGAEFMVHSFSGGEQTYVARGFLVVEVALYPPHGQNVDVHSGNFVMYINGRKQELLPQPPSLVAASIAHPDWNSTRHVEANAGAGPVSVGRPMPAQVPHAQTTQSKPEQVLIETALPQGEHHAPVSGFLFFAYSGRVQAIKSLELRYEDAILRLR